MGKILLIFFTSISAISSGQSNYVFFPGDFRSRDANIPAEYTLVEKPSGPSSVTVTVANDEVITPLSGYVFGNNANVYMTQMVDQTALIDHIKKLAPNVIRFPGGNLSSVYFWNAEPGLPPADAPAKLVDANGNPIDPGYWYGKNEQSWTLSLDNYYRMLVATSSTGILTVNYGYARYSTAEDPVAAAAHLAAEWVRYDNGRTRFWEIGNESNGSWQAGYRINVADNHDGQPEIINGDLYGTHFKVFADSMRRAAEKMGHTIYIGAQLLAEVPASWWNDTDRNWNKGVFEKAGELPDYYIIHSYYTPYQTNSSVTEILNSATTVTKSMMDYVSSSVSAAGLPAKPVALTEWNIFAEGSKQQVSFVSGMHAAIVAGELIRNRYALACRWDLANGWNNGNDHGMFSQGDQPGVPKWHPRPVYFYLYFFQRYFGDQMIASTVSGSAEVLAYASKFSSGETGLVIVNKGSTEETISVNINGFGYGEKFYLHSLTGGTDNGSFSLKVLVNGEGTGVAAGGPPDAQSVPARASDISGGVKFNSPGRSVQYILIEKGDNIITATEAETVHAVQVFPNPSQKTVSVSLPGPGFSKVELVDLQGRKVYERHIGDAEVSFDVSVFLEPGVYSLLFHKEGKIFKKKIIIY